MLPSGRAQARSRRLFLLRLVGFSAHYGGGLAKTEALLRVAVTQIFCAGCSPLENLDGGPCSASAAQPNTAPCFTAFFSTLRTLNPGLHQSLHRTVPQAQTPGESLEHNGPAEPSETRKVYGTQ